jgi:DNA repair exonuclease SbcCD ATPase subunit
MKLLELEIQGFKGALHPLKIEPNGKNFVIFGPNGSGKSTVVDALDFLLTGNVSRMSGPGTTGIKLNKHAKHVHSKPKDVKVKAKIELENSKKPVLIERSLKERNNLIYDPNKAHLIEPLISLASRGQHVLTKREILTFITSKSSDRSKIIENLLKLDDINDLKEKLNDTRKELKKEYESNLFQFNSSKASIETIIDTESCDKELILNFINKNRTILNADSLDTLDLSLITKDVKNPGNSKEKVVNYTLIENNLDNLTNAISISSQEAVSKTDQSFRKLIIKIESNHELNKTINRLKFNEQGLELIDDTGSCPLCNTEWSSGELQKKLEDQIEHLNSVKEDLNQINEFKMELKKIFSKILEPLMKCIDDLNSLGLEKEKKDLSKWETRINLLLDALKDDSYPNEELTEDNVKKLLVPDDLENVYKKVLATAKDKSPEPSLELDAWYNLKKIEERLQDFQKYNTKLETSSKLFKKSEMLRDAFIESRNQVLEKLYYEIKDRFVELYKELHGLDECSFEAELEPKGNGVNFSVDFHGQGLNPPHALHSEGHQDTMGICLYLALAERVTDNYIDLIILDDVMTSIDSSHRRKICHLLANSFEGRQFFITTHDKIWSKQLKIEGVADNVIEFYDWNIDSGPGVKTKTEIWDDIDEYLKNGDVPAAAARLRRGSEEHFRLICDSLGADIKFKNNGLYDLGELLDSTSKRYNYLLKKAQKVAIDWEKEEEISYFKEIKKESTKFFTEKNTHNWAININVHYNEWADFTLEDFRPVVESYKNLYSLFECDVCNGILHLSGKGKKAESLRCKCNNVNWNLISK